MAVSIILISVDILVSNAGIHTESPSHEVTTADFDRIITTNLRGRDGELLLDL
ncbi:SDR family NAD(P)-dependent oxidoreductase [Anabaena subtropica]|uniref:SDR family NAD(P)-dependent oxidoreductase n=1 Tax=Anabaena subtropica FACHB-260 TaxID=2692884 RepID=A0ABR8CV51_9NOST|nr:SDR family NAD(P)-dependent oxidoreductase [Anabaena subtropica FACHB-260]